MAALRSPFEASCPLPTNTRQDAAKLSDRDMWSTHKAMKAHPRSWLSKTRQLANCLSAHIILLYIVENQTTTAKALPDTYDTRLPRVLFEERANVPHPNEDVLSFRATFESSKGCFMRC
jgi:hypothetical protein